MSKMQDKIGLFRKAFSGYYLRMGLILLLTIISSASEGIGISALIPAFSFVAGGTPTDTVSFLIKDLFGYFGVTYTFRTVLLFIAVLFVVRTIMLFLVQVITARVVFGYERDTRNKLFALTVRAGWPYLSKQKLGHLSQLLMSNASTAAGFFNNLSIISVIVTKILAYLLVSINISPYVALFAIVGGSVALYLFKPIFAKGRGYSFTGERLGRDVSHFVNQHISGIKTLKTMAIEEPVITEADHYFTQLRALLVRQFSLRGLLQMMIALGGLVFIGLAFAVLYRLPGFQIATFGVVVYALNQIFTQIQLVQGQLQTVGSVWPYMLSLIKYADDAQAQAEDLSMGTGAAPITLSHSIDFSSVSFNYPERDATLSDITFSIPSGSRVGIVGPSGAGKTTLTDLLLRFYEPTSGEILVDGVALSKLPLGAWRSKVGYVTQDIFLLNDTLANNIAFYAPLSREEIIAAAKVTNIHEFIESLPQGYDTPVGERGVMLSGGQRQRIVLARVLARKPTLLILDEATSALDAESEKAIQETIENLHGNTTTLVIAHRLSTMANADIIVALEGGKVVEMGSPQELLADKNSYFSKVSELQ